MIVRGVIEAAHLRTPSTDPSAAPTAALAAECTKDVPKRPCVRFTGPTSGGIGADRVSSEVVASLVGGQAFLRIARSDGRIEIVAAEIKAFADQSITLGRFDVDAAHRLACPGDDFWVHVPSSRSPAPVIVLAPGDSLMTAVALPLQIGTTPRLVARRLEIRTHAQAIVEGSAQPMHALDCTELSSSAKADIKAEQNAIVMALARPLTELFAGAARTQGISDEVAESSQPLVALEQSLLTLSTHTTNRFVRDLLREEGPLGRAWARLGAVHTFTQRHLPGAVPSDSPTRLLDQGLWTAIEVVSRMAEVAHTFARGHGLDSSAVLRASLPLVAKMAATHQKVLYLFLGALEDGAPVAGRWSPEHFRLVDGRLELTPELVARVAREHGARFDALPSRTTGCPAAQSLGGPSPVKVFVEVYAELVAKLEAKGAL